MTHSSARFAAAVVGLALLSAGAVLTTLTVSKGFRKPVLPFTDAFSQGRMSGWQAFGGNWTAFDGGIRNNSNERGAKLIAGKASWTDYSLDTDLELLGQGGDAGVIVRATDEELGVDAYSGYYAGLRTSNNMVVLGRADHGWMEYQVAALPGGIHAFHVYHLRVVAVGCQIAAIATDPTSENTVTVALREEHCASAGMIGLRSYSSGGLWRNIRAAQANAADINKVLQNVRVADSPDALQTEAGFNALLGISSRPTLDPWNVLRMDEAESVHSPSLRALRLFSGATSPIVDVHGTVVLTSPELFLQDATGGIAIREDSATPLKIGDEIEVAGTVTPRPFSALFDKPKIRFLWSGEPAPALAVTASQAATGQFDAMFIEVEGRIKGNVQNARDSLILELEGAHQRFSAILFGAGKDSSLGRLRPDSLVRIRGVCVTDTGYTHNLIPFAVLLPTADDVILQAGPPWWSAARLLQFAWFITGLTFLSILVYFWAERWRLRAVLEERSRLAREIHDTLAQSFAGIALQLESSLIGPAARIPDLENVETALQMARQSRREAHVTIAALRSLSTEKPLAEVLQKALAQQTRAKNLELSITTVDAVPRLGIEVETQILRIAQEAVANSVQHSHASHIEVRIAMEIDDLVLSVIDDGMGFNPAAVQEMDGAHFGILGMTERAKAIRANVNIHSTSKGTTVTLVVPNIKSRLGIESRLGGASYIRAFGSFLKMTWFKSFKGNSNSEDHNPHRGRSPAFPSGSQERSHQATGHQGYS